MSKLLSMIRRKPKYMDLSVVGNPTINNSVVSNFSTSNYVQLLNPFAPSDKDFEIVIKFKCYNFSENVQQIFYFGIDSIYNSYSGIDITSAGRVRLIAKNIFSTDPFVSIQTNTDTWVRLKRKGNSVNFATSSDGVNYGAGVSTTVSGNLIWTGSQMFGVRINQRVFDGEIDFNNSYIIQNGIKNKFRFAIPLTKVGNPTINNGIVSDFSTSDYLKFINNLIANNYNKTEIVICLTTPNSFSASNTFLALGINYFYFNTNRKISAQIRLNNANKWIDCQTALSLNTKYWIKIISDTVDNSLQILYSTDGINFILDGENTSLYLNSDFGTTKIGARDTNSFQGNIDIPNSYNILDGTKYIYTIGV